MSVEDTVRNAIVDELKRQAEISESKLQVTTSDGLVTINGPVDLDDLVMVIVGSLAGGP